MESIRPSQSSPCAGSEDQPQARRGWSISRFVTLAACGAEPRTVRASNAWRTQCPLPRCASRRQARSQLRIPDQFNLALRSRLGVDGRNRRREWRGSPPACPESLSRPIGAAGCWCAREKCFNVPRTSRDPESRIPECGGRCASPLTGANPRTRARIHPALRRSLRADARTHRERAAKRPESPRWRDCTRSECCRARRSAAAL
jgi:hypothetical protein